MELSTAIGGSTKRIVESIVTSGIPPEEMLNRLDSYGIEWYLTERGRLFIRYWQIGAEDFIRPEQIAEIRDNQNIPHEATALEWLSNQLSAIRAQYINCWIAIDNEQVVADADNLPALLEKIQDAGIETPFITFIPADPIIWNTAYDQQKL
jgi:hypothetical protein